MPRRIIEPTWVLLSPNKLPDGKEREKILESIVPDFENPAQNAIPPNASKVIPKSFYTIPTEDGNYQVALLNAKTEEARARLGDILKFSFNKSIKNDLDLRSTLVKTYAVAAELSTFKLLKRRFSLEISELIGQVPSRNHGAVFMIVAIKTCVEAEISSGAANEQTEEVEAKVPIKEIILESTGVNIPINPDVRIGGSHKLANAAQESQKARGERIFAVQYRLINKRKQWIKMGRPRLPPEFKLNDYVMSSGPSMYGDMGEADATAEDGGEEDEEEDESNSDDEIQLGDLEHMWSLNCSTQDGIVLTTL